MPDLVMLLPIEYRQTSVSQDFGAAIKCPGGVVRGKNGEDQKQPDQWWQYNDGGRWGAGFIGDVGDCATRAIAIATDTSYREVYDSICALAGEKEKFAQAHMGATSVTIESYLEGIGWRRRALRSHLNADELPNGRLIIEMPRHLVAVIDGVINDLFDSSRGGTAKITGYYTNVDEFANLD